MNATWFRAAAFLSLFLMLMGCGSGKNDPGREAARAAKRLDREAEKAPVARAGGWGRFSGAIETRWEDDGLTMVLLNELRYTDPYGQVWIAPAGSRVNGASIPRAFWGIIGGPFEGKYRNASVLHDVAYGNQTRPWQEADRMFYNAMRCGGVGAITAKTMYYTLVRHGRHWKHPKGEALSPETNAQPVPDAVDEIQKWIQANDPSIEQIEARATTDGR